MSAAEHADTADPGSATPAPQSVLPWVAGGLCLLFGAVPFLRPPHPYGVGHWLLHYEYGFVKRGLVGSLVRVFTRGKTPDEVSAVVTWCAAVVAMTCGAVMVVAAVQAYRRTTAARLLVILACAVFLLSPFIGALANLTGYFDQLLVLIALGGIAAIGRGRFLVAGLLSLLALLTHEMWSLYGLPLVCFAALIHLRAHPEDRAKKLTALLVPTLLGVGAVLFAEHSASSSVAAGHLRLELTARSLVPGWVDMTLHALEQGIARNLAQQSPHAWAWFTNGESWTIIHPTTIVLTVAAIAAGRRAGLRYWEHIAAVIVIVAPLFLALLGWDWMRFFTMPQFHAWGVLLVCSALPPATRSTAALTRLSRAGHAALAAAGCAALALSHSGPRTLTAPGPLGQPFAVAEAQYFPCEALLFLNSDFRAPTLEPWTAEGTAFDRMPLRPDTAAARQVPARPLGPWVGTSERHGDGATGEMISPAFHIAGDRIAFRVGGDSLAARVFVSLSIDGDEVSRVTGTNHELLRTHHWDVSEYRGRLARITVADHSAWGHINVGRFCYGR